MVHELGASCGQHARAWVTIDARFEVEWWCEPGASCLDAVEVLIPRIEIKWYDPFKPVSRDRKSVENRSQLVIGPKRENPAYEGVLAAGSFEKQFI